MIVSPHVHPDDPDPATRAIAAPKLQYNSDSVTASDGGTNDFLFVRAKMGNLIYPALARAF